jgi:hypothetical protein
MSQLHLRSAALGTMLLMSSPFAARAQQQPGSNVPTPAPASDFSTTVPSAPAPLQEPVIDPRTERSTLPNTPLLVTGLVVFGTSYGASAVAAGFSDRPSDDKLYYPVVGPWLSLSDRDCAADPCDRKALGTTLLVGSGVLQGLGAASMLLSLVIPRTTTREWYLIGNEDVLVAPLLGAGELGAVAVGNF